MKVRKTLPKKKFMANSIKHKHMSINQISQHIKSTENAQKNFEHHETKFQRGQTKHHKTVTPEVDEAPLINFMSRIVYLHFHLFALCAHNFPSELG